MKIKLLNRNSKRKFMKDVLIVIITVIGIAGMIVLSSCNVKEDVNSDISIVEKSSEEVNSLDPEISPTIDPSDTPTETQSDSSSAIPSDSPENSHEIDMNPSPLGSGEETLSLEGYGAKGALSDSDLSILDMLTYAVQDEYLARGEYIAIMDEFGEQKPYSNIVRSEESHLEFLRDVYLSYNLAFPEDISANHIIVPQDLLEAAKTGVQAEIDNIAMYEKFLEYDLPENVSEVFEALKKGSDSHLLAFQKQVDRLE